MSRRAKPQSSKNEPSACVVCGKPLAADDTRHGYGACDECRHVPTGAFYYLWIAAEDWFRHGGNATDPVKRFGKRWRRIRELSCSVFDHRKFTGETWQRLRDWLEVRSGTTWEQVLYQPVDTIIEWLWVADSERKEKSAAGPAAKPRKGKPAAEYNVEARKYLQEHPQAGPRELIRALGCGSGTIYKLSAYQAVAAERKKGRKPKAVSLTKAMADAATKADGELAKLVREQQRDDRTRSVGSRERI